MITGFSFDTKKEEWLVDWQKNNKWSFKSLFQNDLGYFIKLGKGTYYLSKEETEDFNKTREALKQQGSIL